MMDSRAVSVLGLPSTCNSVKVGLYLKSACNAEIESVKIESKRAVVLLKNLTDVEKFCSTFPMSYAFGGKTYALTIEQSSEKQQEKSESKEKDVCDFKIDKVYTWYDLEDIHNFKKGILVQCENLPVEKVFRHFQNEANSEGGPIAKIIRMLDGLLIFFKDDTVTDRVWDFRPHRVNHHPVRIFLKHVPVCFDEKLIMKADADAYTEQDAKDDLELCCPNESTIKPKSVKMRKPFTMCARYSKSVDPKKIDEIINECQKHFKGKIQRLLRTDCIKAEKLPPDVGIEEMTCLFENVSRVDGGPVTLIEKIERTSMLIHFSSYKDAENVLAKCKKDGITLFGHTIQLSEYFHCFEEKKNPVASRSKSSDLNKSGQATLSDGNGAWVFIIPGLDKDLATFFLKKSEHIENLNKDLAPVTILLDQNGLKISCQHGNVTKEGTERKVKRFLDQYSCRKVEDFDRSQIILVRTTDCRFQSTYTGDDEKVFVRWTGRETADLICVGLKEEVDAFIASLKESILKMKSQMVVREEELRWLVEWKIVELISRRTDTKIKIVQEKNQLEFSGNKAKIQQAQSALKLQLRNIDGEKYDSKYGEIKAFLVQAKVNPEISGRLHELIKADKIQVSIVVTKDDEVFMWGKNYDITQAKTVLDINLKKQEISGISVPLNDPSRAATWQRIQKVTKDGLVDIKTQGALVVIVGFKDEVAQAVRSIEIFQDSKPTLVRMPYVKAKLITEHCDGFHKLCSDEEIKAMKICAEGIELQGNGFQVAKVTQQLKTWESQITEKHRVLQLHGIVDFFKTEDAHKLITSSGAKYQTTVMVRQSLPKPQENMNAGPVETTLQPKGLSTSQIGPFQISVYEGDITEEKTDAIVNVTTSFALPTGTLFSAILKKAGDTVETELLRAHQPYVRVTSAGKLKAKRIIHVLTPMSETDLQNCVNRILTTAIDRKSPSVSIPALGPGTVPAPIYDIAMRMLMEIQAFSKRGSAIKHLKKINIVIWDKGLLSGFCKALSAMQDDTEKLPHNSAQVVHHALAPIVSRQIKRLKVSIREGDITEEANDAIVNSVGAHFDLSKGMVSRAILAKAGSGIQAEVYQIRQDMIRVSGPGRLKCGKILHAVTPTTKEHLYQLVLRILNTADAHRCKSISVPALATGNLGIKAEDVAKIMAKAFHDFSGPQYSHLSVVDIVILDRNVLEDFVKGFSKSESGSSKGTWFGWGILPSPISSISSYFDGAGKPGKGLGQQRGPVIAQPTSEYNVDSERVDLVLCSFSESRVDLAWNEVKSEIDKLFTEFTVKEASLGQMMATDITKIPEIGKRHGVLVKIDQTTNHISMEGLRTCVNKTKQEIDDFLSSRHTSSSQLGQQVHSQSTWLQQPGSGGSYPHLS